MKEAMFFTNDGTRVFCYLCPHSCKIEEGKLGFCQVRKNIKGKLYTLNYGKVSAIAVDPIEKKPLKAFRPGTTILSVGSLGCNLDCGFCQNHEISKSFDLKAIHTFKEMTPKELVSTAIFHRQPGIAYTYNEPTVYYEYVYETAQLVKKAGLYNVLVTNGFISEEPLKRLLPLVDAMNIDIKTYDKDLYRSVCHGSLIPVVQTAKKAYQAGVHVEITCLLVPKLFSDLHKTDVFFMNIRKEIGDVYIHLSRYFPRYKFDTAATDIQWMIKVKDCALKYFSRVALGNVQ